MACIVPQGLESVKPKEISEISVPVRVVSLHTGPPSAGTIGVVITGHEMVDVPCTPFAAAIGVAVRVCIGDWGGVALTTERRRGGVHGVDCIIRERGCQEVSGKIRGSGGLQVSPWAERGLSGSEK